MKKYLTNINLYYLSITIFSLMTLYPFLRFVLLTLEQFELGTRGLVTADELNEILNRQLSDPSILIPFIIGIFSWIPNIFLSLYFLQKKKIAPSFAYSTLILGGIGVHAIVWIFIKIKQNLKNKIDNKYKDYIRFGILGLIFTLITAPFMSTTFSRNFNSAFIGKTVKLSLNINKPNLIEVFSDGFWRRAQTKKISNDKRFEDFKIYDKYLTFGESTYYSLPTMLGDFVKNNKFSLLYKKNNCINNKNYVKYMQKRGFVSSFKEHMDSKYFSQNTVINPIGLSNQEEYNANVSGDPIYLKKQIPNLNITNWSGARDDLGFGVHDASPDVNSYKWLNKNLEISNNNSPSRVYISDMITHPSYMSNRDGTLLISQATKYDQWILSRNMFGNLFAALKNIKKGGVNAYDNSMIIIYGDHKDHSFVSTKKGEAGFAESHESLMILKYPNQKKPTNQISDKVVWSAQLNKIINNFISHPTSKSLEDFIEKNPQFGPNKKRWIMHRWNNNSGIMRATFGLNPSYNPNGRNSEFATKYSLITDLSTGIDYNTHPNDVIKALKSEVY